MTTSDTLVDRIPMHGDRFMQGVFELRALCHVEGSHYLFCDGSFVFDPFPNETGTNMALIADTKKRVATFVGTAGEAYTLKSVDLRQNNDGLFYVAFDLGDFHEAEDEHRLLINQLSSYMKQPITIADTPKRGGYPQGSVPGISHLLKSWDRVALPGGDERIESTINNLVMLYGLASSREIIRQTASLWAPAFDVWCTRHLVQYDADIRASVLATYERHCRGMTEIRGLRSRDGDLRIERSMVPSVYGTVRGKVNDRYIFTIDDISSQFTPSIIPTALPWISVLRLPESWWVDSASPARDGRYTKWLYEDGKRKFCDVHLPFIHRGGIDEFLLHPWDGFRRTPVFKGSYALDDWIKDHVKFLSGSPWRMGSSYHPEDVIAYDLHGVRTGSRYPWLTGPRFTRSGWQGRPWPRETHNRKGIMRIGQPDISLSQSRHGLNNKKAIHSIRHMAYDMVTNDHDFLVDYQPNDHVLACFYYLISRRSEHDVKQLLHLS